MDIHKWLESSGATFIDSEQHNLSLIELGHDAFNLHIGVKRKHCKTDGSFIGPLEARLAGSSSGQVGGATLTGTVSAGSNSVGSGGSLSLSSSSESTSIQQTESSRSYRKRARHKTRPEKYETGHRKHLRYVTRKHKHVKHESHNEDKKKKTKKKGNRKKTERRSTGLVQTFHAKNVSRNRLTVGPSITKHTSTAVLTSPLVRPNENRALCSGTRLWSYDKSRLCVNVGMSDLDGCADHFQVPDLIFSEMRFLQKGDVRDDSRSQTALRPQETRSSNPTKNSQKKRKTERAKGRTNNRRNAEEKEISTYFQDSRANTHDDNQEVPRERSPMSDHMDEQIAEVLAESPGRQFLGFGSSGKSLVSASNLSCPKSFEPTVSSPKSSHHQPRPIVIGRLRNTVPNQTIDKVTGKTDVTENAIGSGTRLTWSRDGPRKDSEPLEWVATQAGNEKCHSLMASNTERFTQPVLGDGDTAEPTHTPKPSVADLAVKPQPDGVMEAWLTSPGKGNSAAHRAKPQSARELSSSPLGKLLKMCNATSFAAKCKQQNRPEILKYDETLATSMCTREGLAVSLPMPDIYIHQDPEAGRPGDRHFAAESPIVLEPEETTFVSQQATWVEEDEHVDATAWEDYYWIDERGSLGGEFYAELQHERVEHGQEDPEDCDVPVERCQFQSDPLDDFAGFWQSNTLY